MTRRVISGAAVLVSVLINVLSMSNLVHDNGSALNAETDAVVACPDTIPPGQVAREPFDATDGWPGFQALKNLADPLTHHARQAGELLHGIRLYLDVCHAAHD